MDDLDVAAGDCGRDHCLWLGALKKFFLFACATASSLMATSICRCVKIRRGIQRAEEEARRKENAQEFLSSVLRPAVLKAIR
jgi:hypothetical protein